MCCHHRFYRCLKSIDGPEESAADLVGHLFFNVMAKSCFVLRHDRVCTQTYLLLWCAAHTTLHTAQLQSSMEY